MSTTATQKFAVLCMPVAAVGLAYFTADPSWSPRREHYASWKETMERTAAEKAVAAAPVAKDPAAKDPAAKDPAAKDPAAKDPSAKHPTAKDPTAKDPSAKDPAPVAKKDPEPTGIKPALPKDDGIEYKIGGLPPSRNGGPLKNAAAERLDLTVAISGAYKVGVNFADPATAKAAIDGAPEAQKTGGLLFVLPNMRSPWEEMKPILNAGAGAGWARIGIAVAHPDNPGVARVLAVRVPAGPQELPKGIDAITVKVGVGPSPLFVLNGEECKDAAALEAKAKALHEECELMTEGYTGDIEKTPWTVDGTGAMVGGVITALDALNAAGVKTVRILGVQKPAAGVESPAVPVPDEEKK